MNVGWELGKALLPVPTLPLALQGSPVTGNQGKKGPWPEAVTAGFWESRAEKRAARVVALPPALCQCRCPPAWEAWPSLCPWEEGTALSPEYLCHSLGNGGDSMGLAASLSLGPLDFTPWADGYRPSSPPPLAQQGPLCAWPAWHPWAGLPPALPSRPRSLPHCLLASQIFVHYSFYFFMHPHWQCIGS